MTSHLTCDVAIIGAGTAGLAAERSARRRGARTLLIDDRFAGTTCATVGCMPSKLLIAAADAAHAVRRAHLFGIETSDPVIDDKAVLARLHSARDKFVAGVKASFGELPEGVAVKARAHFTGPTTLALDDGRSVSARAIVIATGSVTSIPPAFDPVRDRILTNETLFDLTELPRSVGVIGAGPLGLELAQALVRLGVEVMVFDQGSRFAALADAAVADNLRALLSREMPIHLGVTPVARAEGDGVMLSWTGESEGERRFDRLLLAAGRPPQVAGLGLEQAAIALDDHGTPCFDAHTMQCGDAPIFIAGDADHDRAVLHEASSEGTIAGRNAASFPEVTPGTRFVPFSIMFTDPPMAVIGTVPEPGELSHVVGCASYEDQGRAKVFARTGGLVHLYADRDGGRLIGASMVGPGVEHSAHLIAWAVQQRLTATEVLDLPFYHPTYEEGLKPALRSICQTVHAPTPPDRDDGVLPGS